MGYQEVSKKKANLGNGPGNGPIPTPQPVSRLPSILIEPAGGSSSYSTPAAEEADVKSGKGVIARAVAVWERFACGCGGAGGQSPSIGFPADTCRYRCWPVKTICPLPRTRQFAGLGCPPDTTALNTAIVTQDCRYGQRCNPGHPRPVRSQRQRSQPGGSTWSASFRIPWLPDQARTTRPCRSWPDHRWQTNRWQTQKRCEPALYRDSGPMPGTREAR